MAKDDQYFTTADMYLAAYLTARAGEHTPEWSRTADGHLAFVFENHSELRGWITDYLNSVDFGRPSLDALRAIKTLIHTRFFGEED